MATDGTLGRKVTLHGGDITIGAGLGQQRGGNLFHSFQKFDVETQGKVTFTGPGSVKNVIGRVTGGERSSIDGTLASSIPNADLYLINLAGILFGPNAQLNVMGSFHASTAQEMRFADGAVFSAADPAGSTLTVAPPEAFGFLGAPPAPILVDGSFLSVADGKSLSLVGGDIVVDNAGLFASDGTIGLAAASGPAEVAPVTGAAVGELAGQIALTDAAADFVSGPKGAGRAWIRGGQIVIGAGSVVFAGNFGAADGTGGIQIDGGSISVTGKGVIADDVFDSGGTGGISIRADRLEVADGGSISGRTIAGGDAANVDVTAKELVVRNGGIDSSSVAGATGDAGAVTVTSDRVEIGAGGLLRSSTLGAGDAGVVTVSARDLVVAGEGAGLAAGIFAETEPGATGRAGAVRVEAAGEIDLRSGGVIGSTTLGAGDGGAVTVTAGRLVVSRDGAGEPTGISAQAGLGSAGNAGAVTVSADAILIENGGTIESAAFGTGDGGRVLVQADTLSISGDRSDFATGISASSQDRSTGRAGEVAVRARALAVADGGEISSDTRGRGDAGAVAVAASDVVISGGGSISSATAGAGNGGTVTLEAASLLVTGDASGEFTGVLAQAESDSTGARAGDVAVAADRVELRDGGQIASGTFAAADAGAVAVRARTIDINGGAAEVVTGIISDSAPGASGNAGAVTAEATEIQILHGGRVSSSTAGAGQGGSVEVGASRLRIDAQGSPFLTGIAAVAMPGSTGDAGTVDVVAGHLALRNEGVVTSTSRGSGSAGDLELRGGTFEIENADVRTVGVGTDGGRIRMDVDRRIDARRSEVTSSGVRPEPGSSIITIVAPQIILNDSAVVSLTGSGAALAGSGEASLFGDVTIVSADSLVLGSSSTVISGLQNSLGSSLQLQPGSFLDVSHLLQASCAERGAARSTFTRGGRGGQRPSPNTPLPSFGADGAGTTAASAAQRASLLPESCDRIFTTESAS